MKFKSLVQFLLVFIFSAYFLGKVHASEYVNIYFFWGQGCPHCAREKDFLETLEKKDSTVKVHDFEVWYNQENRDKLTLISQKLNTEVGGVPFTVIGDQYLVGYLNDETTGTEILKLIDEAKVKNCPDLLAEDPVVTPVTEENCDETPQSQNSPILPKIGNIELNTLSLPVLTMVMGFLDGFNPCAMWTLLFLISLLLGMENKRKMWALGIAFIVASAAVYLLFMVAWLKLFLFIGFIFWVRFLIALIALGGGFLSLKKFLSKDSSGCDVAGDPKRKVVFEKLGGITSSKSFVMALLGIIGLAFVVNLVELVCSAGLPAVYTQVLALNNLNSLQYFSYIFVYIFFFMLDDLLVFFVAMLTLQMTGITTKYVKYSRLLGGILMVIVGLLLLFKPEFLMFS
jgi:glutaredoxin